MNKQSDCGTIQTIAEGGGLKTGSRLAGQGSVRLISLSLFLAAMIAGTGQAVAARGAMSLQDQMAVQAPRQEVPGSYQVAQMENVTDDWQAGVFRAIEIQKRLDALEREGKKQKTRPRTRRRAKGVRRKTERRRVQRKRAATSGAKKAVAVKAAKSGKGAKIRAQASAGAGASSGKPPVVSPVANISASKSGVAEPLKLQRCLQKAGYLKGKMTGRLDERTRAAFLAFRKARNMPSLTNDAYDAVAQKALFERCDGKNGLSKTRIIARAPRLRVPRTLPPRVTIEEPPVLKKMRLIKPVASRLPKAGGNKTGKEGQIAKAPLIGEDGPLTTASIAKVKKNAAASPGKDQSAKSGEEAAGGEPPDSEDSFARDVLAATDAPAEQLTVRRASSKQASGKTFASSRLPLAQVAANGKNDKPESRQAVRKTGTSSSSFAVKRLSENRGPASVSSAAKPVFASRPAGGRRVASAKTASSSPFPKSLSFADLAKAAPASKNTCSPQKHEPKVAMSRVPVFSSVPPVQKQPPALQLAHAYEDEAPIVTGSISAPSTLGKKIRSRSRSSLRLAPASAPQTTCLPQDLYDLLATTHGRKTGVSVCKPDCLPAPASFSKGQLELFARQYDIQWCGATCLGIADPLPLREVMKIEREAQVRVCTSPQTRLLPAVKRGLDSAGVNGAIRALYDRLPGGYGNRDNIAIIIGNRHYDGDLRVNDPAHVNANAMKALLIEQLGYRPENVLFVKDAKRSDFVRLFGKRGDASGEVQKRLRANPDAQLLIYYSGHASTSGLGMENYLLPVDAVAGMEKKSAYSLGVLYENLRKIDARTTQLFLETGFNADRSPVILAPNIAERRVIVAPIVPVRGLAVFSATTGDQKPLVDPESGISLFTRYLLSGLAGKADERPVGNGDRIIDSVELHVHLARNVRLAARKTLGLRQNPTFSRSDNLFLSQLSRKARR